MASLQWSSMWIVIAFAVVRTASALPCVYESRTYQAGQSWYARDGCNICTCDPFYGQNCQTDPNCKPGHTAGEPVCTYYFHTHNIGDVFMAADGCNKCLCTERGMQCTGKACNASGFAKPKFQELPLDCQYQGNDGWYSLGAQWQAVDGCNTCVCLIPANYHGYYTCTTSSCCNAGTTIKDIITAKPKFQELPGNCHYRDNDGWYLLGTQWQAVDGCNTCVCLTPGNYQGYYTCTTSSCCNADTTIKDIITAKPKFQELPGECHYRDNDGWYLLGTQWQAVDGCNTCVCLMPGNYQGYYTCTTSSCCNADTTIKDIITG